MSNELLSRLSEPFEPKYITFKPGASKNDKCLALIYADLRAYQTRLDEVCGMDWSCKYVPWGESRIICELTIAGVTRSSTGEMDAQDEKNNMGGTVAEAQALKRAAVQFGLGRYLYDFPSPWVDFEAGTKRISKAGLNDLEQRYLSWYAKAIQKAQEPRKATPQAKQPPRQVDSDTGEITDFHDALTPDPYRVDGDVLFGKPERVTASQTRLNLMHKRGVEYYHNDKNWDVARPRWVDKATGGAYESSNDLSPEQCEWVIEGLEARIAKRNAAAAQEPIATVA